MMNTTLPKQRILALDILRGITVACMLLVNNPGSWEYVYAPLCHARWIGLTPTDLVFPFFMFIMGISTYISLKKYEFRLTAATAWKVIRRTVLIYLIGLFLMWFGLSLGTHSLAGFEHLRLVGVFPRLGICYGVAAFVLLTMKRKHIPYLIVALLVGYWVVLLLGNGFEYGKENILSVVDRAVLGKHMINDHGIDPEGILSTIPSIAHVLIGVCAGRILLEREELGAKIEQLFRIGFVLMAVGFLLSYGCPISKKVWSPSFVLVSCGLASSSLALLMWVIDAKGHARSFRFFQAFGINPLFTYALGWVLEDVMAHSGLQAYVFNKLSYLCGSYPAGLAYSLLFVCFVWVFGYALYKKNIYIKI